jgi:prepilin-type N-terminal cleavage/methylation domain-containing protein
MLIGWEPDSMNVSATRRFDDSAPAGAWAERAQASPASSGWPGAPRGRDAGFTLLEVVVVVAVLGTIVAVALVGTSHMIRTHRLSGAASTLVNDIGYARSLAAAQGTNFQVQFVSGGYSVVRVSPSKVMLTRSCPSGVTCSASGNATLYGWGLTSPATVKFANSADSVVVQLASNGKITR